MNTTSYSNDFEARIRHLHRGKEQWPHYQGYINAHLGGPGSRLFELRTSLVREMELRIGSLLDRRVLDLGCGTGATTAALSDVCRQIHAFDVDSESVETARARLVEHGRADQVTFHCAKELPDGIGPFDVVLMNGVLEHVPLTIPGLRERIVLRAYSLLKPGGSLFINDTPNRLWPIDGHSTGLPFISWLPAGSRAAYELAVRLGRHAEAPTHSAGPRGLEEVGCFGATYFEIAHYLRGTNARCLNLQAGQDDQVSYASPASPKRQALERALYVPAVKILKAPLTAFTSTLSNLVFQRP